MLSLANLSLPLEYSDTVLRAAVAKKCGIVPEQILSCHVAKRSVDARKKDDVHFVVSVHFKAKNESLRRRWWSVPVLPVSLPR